MATTFPQAPTYAEPVVLDEVTGKHQFNPLWLKWFLDIAAFISSSGGGGGGGAAHNSLSGLQGGGSGEYYHFTASQNTDLAAGYTAGKTLLAQNATKLVRSTVSMNNGAGAGAGTITNAPSAGNPTKWIPIDDNGTTRYVPAW